MAKQKTKSNKVIYWLIGGIVVLVIFLIVGRSAGWIGKPNAVEVELSKADYKTIVEKVSASGTVQPVTELKISPEVSGEIVDLTVEEGDSVKKGELLVKIRPDTWISQLDRARAALNTQKANAQSSEAALERTKATFLKAEQDYNRQEKLWNQKVISEADWQLAQQNYKVAKNDLASAEQAAVAADYVVKSSQAEVNEAQENVRRTSVVAPMSGTISKLSVKQGERVVGTATMAGTEMLRIADLSVMEVRVDVNENDIVKVHLKDSVSIDVDAYPDKKFKGIVTLIANTAEDKTSTDAITEFEVRILILSSSYQDLVKAGHRYPFRPGMTASVDITTNRKEHVLAVPLAAVTTRNPDDQGNGDNQGNGNNNNNNNRNNGNNNNGGNNGNQNAQPTQNKNEKLVVFLNDKGVAKMTEVKTGISDYDNIEITSGLKEGDELVSGPFLAVSKRLKDGDHITEEKKDNKNAPNNSSK